jgi:hypothetical protein
MDTGFRQYDNKGAVYLLLALFALYCFIINSAPSLLQALFLLPAPLFVMLDLIQHPEFYLATTESKHNFWILAFASMTIKGPFPRCWRYLPYIALCCLIINFAPSLLQAPFLLPASLFCHAGLDPASRIYFRGGQSGYWLPPV